MMKKAYTKPEILFEDFSLSQNIAAGCEEKTNTPTQDNCGIDYGPFVVFLNTPDSECTGAGRMDDQGGDGEYNGICYHVFSNNGEKNLFNS